MIEHEVRVHASADAFARTDELAWRLAELATDAVPLELSLPQQPLIQGDERCHAIAAASIVAKVYRDQMMREWDKFYPEYGLRNHKGYMSPEHMAAIRTHGPTPLHRFSFEPVRRNALFSPLLEDRQMEMFAAV